MEKELEQTNETVATDESVELTDTVEDFEELADENTNDGEPSTSASDDAKTEADTKEGYVSPEALKRRLARAERKAAREKAEILTKYGRIEEVLKAAMGTETLEDTTEKLESYYKEEGIDIPAPNKTNGLSQRDVEILANADAEEIINLGIEEMTEEAERLASIGYNNLSEKDKIIFTRLGEKLSSEKEKRELNSIGVTADVLDSKDFRDFRNKFNPKTPVKEVYEMFTKLKGEAKPTPKPIGSMKTTNSEQVKDFYSYEESKQFTKADYDKNPTLFKAVQNSMSKW